VNLVFFTIAMTGASGGQLRGLVEVLIDVPSEEAPRIQELCASSRLLRIRSWNLRIVPRGLEFELLAGRGY
jgi:hypothetical protein